MHLPQPVPVLNSQRQLLRSEYPQVPHCSVPHSGHSWSITHTALRAVYCIGLASACALDARKFDRPTYELRGAPVCGWVFGRRVHQVASYHAGLYTAGQLETPISDHPLWRERCCSCHSLSLLISEEYFGKMTDLPTRLRVLLLLSHPPRANQPPSPFAHHHPSIHAVASPKVLFGPGSQAFTTEPFFSLILGFAYPQRPPFRPPRLGSFTSPYSFHPPSGVACP